MRNREITKTIEEGGLPVLPFEVEVAKSAMAKLARKQQQLGEALGEAMSQSSETWHDNAPAEAVSHASLVLSESAKPVQRILGEGVTFEYSDEVDVVTLGSVVTARFDNSQEAIRYLITGATRELPESIGQFSDKVSVVTLSSPIGKAMFNAKVGDTVEFKVGKRKRAVIIDGINML